MDLTNLDSFRKQIAEAQSSIHTLYSLRRVLDDRISDLRDLVRANANFLPAEERSAELVALHMLKVPENITEAVKISLFVAGARKQRLTPIQVKESAQERGFDFSTYTNPMASIHSILKRMKEAKQPEVDFDEATGTYGYISGLPMEVADEAAFDRFNELAWMKVVNASKEISDKVASDAIQDFLAEVTAKPVRKR